MSPRQALCVAVLLAAAGTCLSVHDARAAWPHDPVNGNVPVSTAAADQRYPSVLSDGQGGAFVAWHDSRNGGSNFDIFIQRVGADGTPLWTANGVSVCGAANDQANTAMVADGSGGVIVAWHDFRAGNWDLYVQRLNAAGVPQWTANGVALCTAVSDQQNPQIVSDGAGGAIVTWADFRALVFDIFAQRIDATGVPQWAANGVVVCNAPSTQTEPRLVSDGANGAIVTWMDARSSVYEVYVQRINGLGIGLWTANGVGLTTATANQQREPKIASDGAGGAIVIWTDMRVDIDGDLYAQRVSPSGGSLWASGGVPISTLSLMQAYSTIAADGQGGAVFAWGHGPSGTAEIHAQRLNALGTVLWPVNGRVVCNAVGGRFDPVVVGTGGGSSIVTWLDRRINPFVFTDIYAQGLDPDGLPLWTTNGVALCTHPVDQTPPKVVADGAGGAIATWHDARNGNQDVFAQRVERFGEIGSPEPTILALRDVPNDQGARLKVEWSPSYLDAFPGFALESYSVWRRAPNAPSPQDATAGGARFRRMAPAFGAQAVDWEYLATLPARGFPAYSYVAPTTSDSIAGSNPLTSFLVLAEKSGGIPYWGSAPDSGYSVDNLAPLAPAPFTGMYAGGSTSLDWGPNAEADLAAYRLYRGTTADFVPGPSSLVATTTATEWVDAAGAPHFYKLAAVDVHGNVSAFTPLAPAGTADAPGLDAPAALRLGIPQPNPAAATTWIEFDLPRGSPVSLVVHDASGRAVRTMLRGAREAGRHRLAWDLRDDAGARVASGVYFVRLETSTQRLSRRIIAIR